MDPFHFNVKRWLFIAVPKAVVIYISTSNILQTRLPVSWVLSCLLIFVSLKCENWYLVGALFCISLATRGAEPFHRVTEIGCPYLQVVCLYPLPSFLFIVSEYLFTIYFFVCEMEAKAGGHPMSSLA